MPWAPRRGCAEPGCPDLAASYATRCARHESARQRDRGYSTRWWRQLRRVFLARHPTCESCGAPATEVDHRDGLGPNGPRGREWDNLAALCARCHGRKSAAFRAAAR